MKSALSLRFLPLALALAACSGNSTRTYGNYFAQPAPAVSGSSLDRAVLEEATVTVRAVDTERQMIRIVRDDAEGEIVNVLFDQNSIVWYQDQQRPIVWLEPGDVVLMELLHADGALHAGRIDVQQTVQQRMGASARDVTTAMQLSGRVVQIDADRGSFQLQTATGTVTIELSVYPRQATLARFRSLRAGEDVRLSANPAGTGRFEIHDFR